MKNINNYIQERLVINSKSKITEPYKAKDKDDLIRVIQERLAKDKNADLNDIDVTNVTDMYELFYKLDPHNIDISEWDVSNVKYMSFMFEGCKNFNCDISNWDVSNVIQMDWMFINCSKFNCDLEKWNVDDVDTYNMFNGCSSMKHLPSWYNQN